MEWVERFLPPPGAPGAIRDAARAWRVGAERVRGLGDHVAARGAVLSSSWWGASKEAYVASTWPFLRQVDAAAGDLERYAAVLDELADGVEAAQREFHARMIAIGATLAVGVLFTVFTATLSDEAAVAAATAEVAAATELAATATAQACTALAWLTAQAGGVGLRVLVFSGVNLAGDALGARVVYDEQAWRHLHVREDLEWGAIGALALPIGSATVAAVTRQGMSLSGASGLATRVAVAGVSMAQADLLVRSALGERIDPSELAAAALPLGAAGHTGRPGIGPRPAAPVVRVLDRVHLPPGDYPSSPLVPGGGLAAHENAAHHTLARHVGLTETQLLARLDADVDMKIVSTFPDRATAERVIAEALTRRQNEINMWLRGGHRGLRVSSVRFTEVIGISLGSEESVLRSVRAVTVVLRRDRSMPCGYRIKTVMLEP